VRGHSDGAPPAVTSLFPDSGSVVGGNLVQITVLGDGGNCAADTIPSAVTVTGATAPVSVFGLKQNGTLTLENDTDEVTFVGSQIDGLVHVNNNAAPAPVQITVSGNAVTGSLYCTGNDPAPADNGVVNTVSGTASGQCAAIAQR
jgi:hypothetical protein